MTAGRMTPPRHKVAALVCLIIVKPLLDILA